MAQNERLAPAGLAAAIGLLSALLVFALYGTASVGDSAARALASIVVYFWAEDVYGSAAALGAALLLSFHPLVVAASPGGGSVVCMLLIAAAVYRAQRCLLDPSLQDAVVVGALGGVALLMTPAAIGSAPLLLALAVAREATRGAHESRVRTRRASAAVLLISGLVLALLWRVGTAVAAPRPLSALSAPPPGGALLIACSLIPLALIGLRPWRAHRRYADASAVAAVVCFGIAAWWCEATPLAAARAALPAAAVLAAAVWDYGTGPLRRGVAWALLAAQIGTLSWLAIAG